MTFEGETPTKVFGNCLLEMSKRKTLDSVRRECHGWHLSPFVKIPLPNGGSQGSYGGFQCHPDPMSSPELGGTGSRWQLNFAGNCRIQQFQSLPFDATTSTAGGERHELDIISNGCLLAFWTNINSTNPMKVSIELSVRSASCIASGEEHSWNGTVLNRRKFQFLYQLASTSLCMLSKGSPLIFGSNSNVQVGIWWCWWLVWSWFMESCCSRDWLSDIPSLQHDLRVERNESGRGIRYDCMCGRHAMDMSHQCSCFVAAVMTER